MHRAEWQSGFATSPEWFSSAEAGTAMPSSIRAISSINAFMGFLGDVIASIAFLIAIMADLRDRAFRMLPA